MGDTDTSPDDSGESAGEPHHPGVNSEEARGYAEAQSSPQPPPPKESAQSPEARPPTSPGTTASPPKVYTTQLDCFEPRGFEGKAAGAE